MMQVKGTVTSGRNKAAAHIAVISDKIQPVLGGAPFVGSLNVILSKALEFAPSALVLSVDGNRHFWQIELNCVPCLASRWTGCPLHVIEVISDCHLRTYFNLTDGDTVTITVSRQNLSNLPFERRLAWLVLWGFRRKLFYTSDRYCEWVKRCGKLRKLAGQRLRPKRSLREKLLSTLRTALSK